MPVLLLLHENTQCIDTMILVCCNVLWYIYYSVTFAAAPGSAGSRPVSSASRGSGSDTAGVQLTTDLNLTPSTTTEVPGYNSLRVQKAYR